MAVTTDILRTWHNPRAVMRDHMAAGPREDRAIAYVMVACLLMFLAQLPGLARIAHLSEGAVAADPSVPLMELDMLIGTAFFGWLMLMPLALYLVAGLVWLVLRAFRLPFVGHDVRLAMFWSLLAASPLALLLGLLNGLSGSGPGTTLVFVLWAAAFVVFWVQALREARQVRQVAQ